MLMIEYSHYLSEREHEQTFFMREHGHEGELNPTLQATNLMSERERESQRERAVN